MALLREELQAPHELLSASTALTVCSSSSFFFLMAAAGTPRGLAGAARRHVARGRLRLPLHKDVLWLRWPWLHLQLQRLREGDDNATITTKTPQFELHLLSSDTNKAAEACPVQTITLLKPLMYTKCLAPAHQRPRFEYEDSSSDEEPELLDIDMNARARKRRRTGMRQQNENKVENQSLTSKRARSLFITGVEDVMMVEKARNVLHVELLGAAAIAMVPVIEYVYTFNGAAAARVERPADT